MHAANAGSDNGGRSRTHGLCKGKPSLRGGLAGGGKQILRDRIAERQFALREMLGRIEILDLGRYPDAAAIGTHEADFADTRAAIACCPPESRCANTRGG